MVFLLCNNIIHTVRKRSDLHTVTFLFSSNKLSYFFNFYKIDLLFLNKTLIPEIG